MANTAVIYWSQTGNTEAMARAIAEGADADLFSVSEVSSEQALTYGRLALGCPAMGAEVLEEEEFEPFFAALESKLCGKRSPSSAPMAGGTASGCATGRNG